MQPTRDGNFAVVEIYLHLSQKKKTKKSFCFVIFLMLYELFRSYNLLLRLCRSGEVRNEKIINFAITLNFFRVCDTCERTAAGREKINNFKHAGF